MDDELLTKDDVGKWLKISRPTIDRWRKQGMPFIKTGKLVRFEKEKVMAWLEQNNINKN